MALVICTECGREVSDRAESCPGCGCPNDLILTNSNIESRRENFDVESFLKKNNIRHGAAMCRVANEFQYQIPSDIFKAKAIYEYAINNSSSCYSVELATDELNNIRRSNPELFDTIPENCDIDSHRSCQQLEYNRDYKSDCQNADGIAFMIQDFVIGAAIGGCMFYIWGFFED